MKHFKRLSTLVCLIFVSVFLEIGTSTAQEKFSTFEGKVIGVRMKLWLDVEGQNDNAVMNFRIGRRTVYTPRRYPNPGEMVKVEYRTQRGVPVAFTVTILEGKKDVPKEGAKEGPTEEPKERSKEGPK